MDVAQDSIEPDKPQQVRIGCRVPADLWKAVLDAGYTKQSTAITDGLKLLTGADSVQTRADIVLTAADIDKAVLQVKVVELESHLETALQQIDFLQETINKQLAQKSMKILDAPEVVIKNKNVLGRIKDAILNRRG